MSESARSILKHLYKEGRMTEEQYEKIDRNLKERPHGEWIRLDKYESVWRCSVCKEASCCKADFCPDCGASMISSNSEIEKSKSEIVPDYRDGWRLKEGEAE